MNGSGAIRTESLQVPRHALVATLGPSGSARGSVRELWYVLHGYAMRAVPFLEDCRAIDDGTRLLVAPEALSRFYVGDEKAVSHRTAAVGASWMTRDERDDEIADYTAYLDALHAHVLASLGERAREVKVTVLGFSQGGAAAARWVAGGGVPAARLIVWGSAFAPELDLASAGTPLRRAETVLVVGTTDRYITPKVRNAEVERVRSTGFPFRLVTFEGGHRLDDETLRALAGGPRG